MPGGFAPPVLDGERLTRHHRGMATVAQDCVRRRRPCERTAFATGSNVTVRHRRRCVCMQSQRQSHSRSPDVVIIGGGGVGLASALELADRGARVTVLSDGPERSATVAAAGMLAPQAERLADGPLLTLCLHSRDLYPSWVSALERQSGVDIALDLSGRFLGPCVASAGELVRPPPPPPPPRSGASEWLSDAAIRAVEPSLGESVRGGWRYGGDGCVDSRSVFAALRAACGASTLIDVRTDAAEVASLCSAPGGARIESVRMKSARGGNLFADSFVLAAGAWTRRLLSLPVRPLKGQMLRLRPPSGSAVDANALRSVLFTDSVYIVPREDGSFVVGATVEDVGFRDGVTAAGVRQLLDAATTLVPGLAHYELAETWHGFRPTTPDLLPILGSTAFENVCVATGHHRNGILLLPVTAKVVADTVVGAASSPLGDAADRELRQALPAFSWRRFSPPVAGASPSATDATASAAVNPEAMRFNQPVDPAREQILSDVAAARGLREGTGGERSALETHGAAPPSFDGAPTAVEAGGGDDSGEILMWKVESDGSHTPIRKKQGMFWLEKGYGDLQPPPSDSSSAKAATPTPESPQEGTPLPDAYDDILLSKGGKPDADSRARSSNRLYAIDASLDGVFEGGAGSEGGKTAAESNGAGSSAELPLPRPGAEPSAEALQDTTLPDAYDEILLKGKEGGNGSVDCDSIARKANRLFGVPPSAEGRDSNEQKPDTATNGTEAAALNRVSSSAAEPTEHRGSTLSDDDTRSLEAAAQSGVEEGHSVRHFFRRD